MADKSKRNKTLETLRFIGQIMGSKLGNQINNNPKEDTGLESEDPNNPPRSPYGAEEIDGFGIALAGNILILKYHGLTTLAQFHEKSNYEQYIRNIMQDNIGWVKKKFKEEMGEALRLEEVAEPIVEFQYMNRHRSHVKGLMKFRVLNLSEMEESSPAVLQESEEFDWSDALKRFRG